MKNIITISREDGSGDRIIDRKLSKWSDFDFYDSGIITQMANDAESATAVINERKCYNITREILREEEKNA